ncbi:MAG: nucleotide exchange factor GrpE [Erysipelotrichales bacterium]|nr:nucleotide exchange factor GrpE [Erysipelotrichales bacterium]
MKEENKNCAEEFVDKINEDMIKLKEIALVQSDMIETLKRQNKTLENRIKNKNEEIFKKLIPILDDIDLVEGHEDLSEGIKIIFKKFKNILNSEGLKEFDNKSYINFDDTLHNAIGVEYYKEDIPNGYIDSIQRKGYKYNDKVIRHADVIVAKNI